MLIKQKVSKFPDFWNIFGELKEFLRPEKRFKSRGNAAIERIAEEYGGIPITILHNLNGESSNHKNN